MSLYICVVTLARGQAHDKHYLTEGDQLSVREPPRGIAIQILPKGGKSVIFKLLPTHAEHTTDFLERRSRDRANGCQSLE